MPEELTQGEAVFTTRTFWGEGGVGGVFESKKGFKKLEK